MSSQYFGAAAEPDSEADEAPRPKKPRFPKGKKERVGDDYGNGSSTEGPIKATDPRLAAKQRATRRNQVPDELFSAQDTSVLDDIAAAEQDYEDGEDLEDDGIKIEPFNLKQEREEGFFDSEGNYVEYGNENEIKDAWLDSVEVDPRFAQEHLAQSIQEKEDNPDLSSEEIGKSKRVIANLLQPGETVLHALRRMKGTSNDKHRRGKMSAETKAMFDQLTDEAMKLMDNGEYRYARYEEGSYVLLLIVSCPRGYFIAVLRLGFLQINADVYHEKKETFEREAEGYERLGKARAGTSVSNRGLDGAKRGDIPDVTEDIFADDETEASENCALTSVSASDTVNINLKNIRASSSEVLGGTTDIYEEVEGAATRDTISDAHGTGSGLNFQEARPQSANIRDDFVSPGSNPGGGVSDMDYVYDESSGYYYSSALGYYYDPNTRLFYSATSSKWYRFNEESNTYEEIQTDSTETTSG